MTTEEKPSHGRLAFLLAALSFVPLIGIIPGVICMVNALAGRKTNSLKLGLLGSAGVLLTLAMYGLYFPRFTG
ncbi:MAG: hypothetical protein ACI9J2_001830 [Saprospiraceae bacterium]|jgi:hypothetical protein